MRVIDAHLHVWDLDRADYPWLGPRLAPIDVSLGLDDVRADPLAILAGGYRRVWGELARIVGDLHPAEREAILGGTAAACYGLETASSGGRRNE